MFITDNKIDVDIEIDKKDIEDTLFFIAVCGKEDIQKNKKIKVNFKKKDLVKDIQEYSKQLKNEIKNYNSIVKLVENKIYDIIP